jgi:hypothetical protein
MNLNIDMYATEQLTRRLRSIQRRAVTFNHSLDHVLDEISYMVDCLEMDAAITEARMEEQATQ